ncbi:glycosyltransferase family 4 protein [Methanococcoides burtonii]|uniref:Glycosyl transferase, group 1 n=1 Tax=Methanococcoides burtonii (strain DSM 6242 / NBRC 107633 / OCM 468 / ACE-M) TaxID=259564 RepID=Q12XY5_METBU|nr:glycosyltransferase family 4 protein [Methanococcoides burtonii]ABE51691.1 Glycosyl transferase, group 1 [Methanococcoides burtonii DSM 6242]
MKPIKLVYVADWNPLTGGAFTVLDNLINTILKYKYPIEIHVVSFGNKNETKHQKGYTIHLVKNCIFPTSQYWYSPKLLEKKIVEINPDLIHLHFTYPPYSFICRLPIPTVVTTHGLVSLRIKGAHSKRSQLSPFFILGPYFEKKALKKVGKVIAVSTYMKNEVEKLIGPNQKTVYIPNGINYEEYTNPDVINDITHPSIFCAGRFIKMKGIDVLIKALPIIKLSIPDIHLYIAGDGDQYKYLQSLTFKLDLQKNITFLNFIAKSKMIQMFASTDLVVVPSRYESFGMVALEALSSGSPVVASSVGGIPEMLDNGRYGMLVKPNDPKELAQQIIYIFNNSNIRKKMSYAGKQRSQDYLWDDIAKRTIEVYLSLL